MNGEPRNTILDCGCVIYGTGGRSWCPTCADGGPRRVVQPTATLSAPVGHCVHPALSLVYSHTDGKTDFFVCDCNELVSLGRHDSRLRVAPRQK